MKDLSWSTSLQDKENSKRQSFSFGSALEDFFIIIVTDRKLYDTEKYSTSRNHPRQRKQSKSLLMAKCKRAGIVRATAITGESLMAITGGSKSNVLAVDTETITMISQIGNVESSPSSFREYVVSSYIASL
ncbi:hypothetical protein Tco_1516578 [Tanacetum coccineum]